jgi:hypothetical protein
MFIFRGFLPMLTVAVFSIAVLSCSSPDPYTSLTVEEATKFAQELEQHLAKDEANFLSDNIDEEAFRQCFADALYTKADDPDIRNLDIFRDAKKLGGLIVQSKGKSGHYRLLRMLQQDGKHIARFRLYTHEGGLNYHDVKLMKRDGKVKVADVFIFMTGETLAETFAQETKFLHSGGGKINQHKAYYMELKEDMQQKQREGDSEGVLAVFDALPGAVQSWKTTLLPAIQASRLLGDTARETKLLQQYQAYHHTPTDRCMLQLIYHSFRYNYDSSVVRVNQLDSLVGKDPSLDFHRAIMALNNDDRKTCIALLEKLYPTKAAFGDVLLYLGGLKWVDGDVEEAKKIFRAYRSMPDYDAAKEADMMRNVKGG